MFHGTYTALVTPFRDGRVDEESLRELIREQIDAGVDGLVPCGSTGESATLTHEEHEQVISATIDEAKGRVRIIAGTGSNSTAEAVRLTKFAKKAGADGALLISPYYNKPTQHGHVLHYRKIAEEADFPIIAYNIPGRTGVNMDPQTISEMAKSANVVGIKEASGSLDQVSRIIHLCGAGFTVLSGDDSLTLPMMSVGAAGVISVTSNLVPKRFCDLVRAAARGDYETARTVHYELLPLMQALFLEVNPIGIKTALLLAGRIHSDELRLPLTAMTEENRGKLEAVLRDAQLID
jgi:4-hydroxy-tetrahydrodipicolinate synthase